MNRLNLLWNLYKGKRNTKKNTAQMQQIFTEKKLGYVQFYVRFVDEILQNMQTGKKRLILS